MRSELLRGEIVNLPLGELYVEETRAEECSGIPVKICISSTNHKCEINYFNNKEVIKKLLLF